MPETDSRLIRLLRSSDRIADLLPALHQEALAASGGTAAVLLIFDARTGELHPLSGYGVAMLPLGAVSATAREAAAIRASIEQDRAVLVTRRQQEADGPSELAATLGTPFALLTALPSADAPGILALGFPAEPAAESIQALEPVLDALGLALERGRLAREAALQRDLRDLLRDFTEISADSLDIIPALEALCNGAVRLFAADRAELWLHDRHSRELVCQASCGPRAPGAATRVSVEDALSVAATALRRGGAELVLRDPEEAGLSAPAGVAIPLRGRRRALGTLVIDGVRVEPGTIPDLLARGDELGRQLSTAIENAQLLDDLLASRRQLEDIFDSLADLVVVCDAEGLIVRANEAFAERVGTSRDELAGRPLADFVGPELDAWVRTTREGPFVPPVSSAVLTDPRLHGSFALSATPFGRHSPGPASLAIVARDITRDRELESVQTELHSRLAQTEKLAALGQFVAGVAHELNNPLQGVLGHLELLRSMGAIPTPIRREVRLIYREAQRAARIVRDLLLFAGSRGFTRRRVPMKALFKAVTSLRAEPAKQRNIELVVEPVPPDFPPISGNPLLLQQALLNIVINAEQAIGKDGRIAVRTGIEGDMVRIDVIDSGPGLAPDVLPRVFEPFFTSKPVGEGTGLGLAVVYGIAREHGGSVTAGNGHDGGAVFTLRLPAHRQQGKMTSTSGQD